MNPAFRLFRSFQISRLLAGLAALTLFSSAMAADLAGVKLDPAVRLGGEELKLNGAGIRYRAIFKVYVAGLYLPQQQKTSAAVLATQGPRRLQLVMLRDVGSADMNAAFTSGIQDNTSEEERNRIAPQLQALGKVFGAIPELRKGDVLTVDWLPASGSIIQLNGRQVSGAIPDLAFHNALLRIWLGEKPVDGGLKTAMLGLD